MNVDRPFDYDSEDDPQMGEHWHLDKRIPLALIFAILVQTAGIVAWGATLTQRVVTLETRADAYSPLPERLTRVEVKLDNIADSIAELKQTIRKADAH